MASVSAEEVDAAAVVRRGCAADNSPLMKMKLRVEALRTPLRARMSRPVIVKIIFIKVVALLYMDECLADCLLIPICEPNTLQQ